MEKTITTNVTWGSTYFTWVLILVQQSQHFWLDILEKYTIGIMDLV